MVTGKRQTNKGSEADRNGCGHGRHEGVELRYALTLLRRSRTAGLCLIAVVADAECGDDSMLRQALNRANLPYAIGISPTLTVFLGTPLPRIDRRRAPPRNRHEGWPDHEAVSVRVLSDLLPAALWRRVAWRNGTNPAWAADFAAVRVTPASDWRHRRLSPDVWLLCERGLGATTRTKYYFIALPRRPRCRPSSDWRTSAGRSNSAISTSRPNSGSTTSNAGPIRAGSTTWSSAPWRTPSSRKGSPDPRDRRLRQATVLRQ
jgi:hypothetical protein